MLTCLSHEQEESASERGTEAATPWPKYLQIKYYLLSIEMILIACSEQLTTEDYTLFPNRAKT